MDNFHDSRQKLAFFENNTQKVATVFANQSRLYQHLIPILFKKEDLKPSDYELLELTNPEISIFDGINQIHSSDFKFTNQFALGDNSYQSRIAFPRLGNAKISEFVSKEVLQILRKHNSNVVPITNIIHNHGLTASALLDLKEEDLNFYINEIEKLLPELSTKERYIFINRYNNSKSFALDHTQHLAYLLHFAFSAYFSVTK